MSIPNDLFYEGKVRNGPDVAKKTAEAWHQLEHFQPVTVLDVSNGREIRERSGSLSNAKEVDVIIAQIHALVRYFSVNGKFLHTIGICSIYRSQVQKIEPAIAREFDHEVRKMIEVYTVDSSQGLEKDITFLSCVRTGGHVKSIGFIGDRRRLAVALTRARSTSIIVGDAGALRLCDENWESIVDIAKCRGSLITNVSASMFSNENLGQSVADLKLSMSPKQIGSSSSPEKPAAPPTTANCAKVPASPHNGPGVPVTKTKNKKRASESADAPARKTKRRMYEGSFTSYQ